MAVALSFLYRDRSYYYESDGIAPFFVGKEGCADLVIADLPVALSVSFARGQTLIRVGDTQEISAPLDRFVILDDKVQIAVYVTKLTRNDQQVLLPRDGEWQIGRRERNARGEELNQIVIGLPYISSTHCKVVREKGVTTIVDNGSKNGIFLNGKKVQKARLSEGDVLSIFTTQITLKGDFLVFKNTADSFKAQKLKRNTGRKSAPKKAIRPGDLMFSRSPRMIASVENREITLEKPPQSGGTPQMNWISILLMPAISLALMLVLSLTMGMNAGMMIISSVMSVISAVVAIVNYKKQKKQHEGMEGLVDKKYRAYLDDVSSRIANNKKKQLTQLTAANPSPAACVTLAQNRDRNLWERSVGDQDFLAVRLGVGTIASALTAQYKQPEVVLTESTLEVAAKKIAEDSRFIKQAPILCDLAGGKLMGITGGRTDAEQLVRNMLVSIAAAHSYDEVKLVILASEDEAGLWGWTRWLPHCANDQMTERYIFTSMDEAEETLDAINDVLSRRCAKDDDYSLPKATVHSPHYVFVALHRQMIERHPIRRHLFSANDCGCSCLFVYDSIGFLPKECNEIIEIRNGVGEVYSRHNTSAKRTFTMDKLSLNDADAFARALAPLRIQLEGQGATLPNSISFLSGYGVTRPEQLNIGTRWKNAKPYKSLSVPIAATAGEDAFFFDIHEKRHGVNGIVAGMPGSGKTEMVQTWLLSLAVNYSPQDVSFILIDFKGTGMIAPFKNLPHLAGSISNLDTNIDRNLIAIQSEVHRREAMIDKYSDKNIKNVNDLNKAYEKGLVPEKLPILLVVIDEYAEFKKIFPDFGAEIDSLTSKGRALGMFVVLMTQKPAGVVSAKSEDNIKFRWCLRVANYAASREMLGRTDAAKISVPGRAYIKVGEDDVYEQVQSYWSGAPYLPDSGKKKKTDTIISYLKLNGKRVECESRENQRAEQGNESEIDVTVRYITAYCAQNRIAPAEKIWTEKLPEKIVLNQVQPKQFREETGWPEAANAAPIVGLVDDPEKQQQYPLALDFAKLGHILVYGAPVSGKTTFLQTLIMSAAMSCRPDVVNIYAMDFGGWNLNILKNLPHVGGIANDNEPERIKKLAMLLMEILEERKEKFSKAGVGNVDAYREITGSTVSNILLIIDNFGPVLKMYPELEPLFIALTSSGANYGVYMVATASATNAVPLKITQNIKHILALQMIDKSDYTYTVGKTAGMLPAIPGRGYAKGNPPLEFQTALPAPGESSKAISENIRMTADAMNRLWTGDGPNPIPELPAYIPYGSVKGQGACLGLSTERVTPVCFDPTKQHFLLISAMEQKDRCNMLQVAVRQLREKLGGSTYVFDGKGDSVRLKNFADMYLSDAKQIDAFVESLRPELQSRYSKKQEDPSCSFPAITIAVDSYSQFFNAVSNDTISRLLAIAKIGTGLNIHLIVADEAYALTSMINKGEAVLLSLAKGKYAVMLGGCMNDHAGISVKASYSQKTVSVKEQEGFFVDSGVCIQFKAMNSTGETLA